MLGCMLEIADLQAQNVSLDPALGPFKMTKIVWEGPVETTSGRTIKDKSFYAWLHSENRFTISICRTVKLADWLFSARNQV